MLLFNYFLNSKGFDTTATSLAYTVHLLGNNKHVLEKLQQEVEAVLRDDKFVTKEHLNLMPYLDAVYKVSDICIALFI